MYLSRDQLQALSPQQIKQFFQESPVADSKEWLESQKVKLETLETLLEQAHFLTPKPYLSELEHLQDRIREHLDGTYASIARLVRNAK
jgi:hypothetical protein